MHPVLNIPEILYKIFKLLLDDETISQKDALAGVAYPPQTLPGIARTCKAFLEPALDVIWHSVPTLAPLLQYIPANRLRVEHGQPTAGLDFFLFMPLELVGAFRALFQLLY